MIIWLYPSRHDGNPILVQAICSLIDNGHSVVLLDRSRSRFRATSCEYTHIPVGWLIPRIFKVPFLIEMFVRCLILRPELILASDPDVGWVGKVVSSILNVPLVYYPFELYGEEYSRQRNFSTKFWMAAERLLLRVGVDLLVTQNEERASVYFEERNATIDPLIIRNYKVRIITASTGALRRRINADDRRIVLYQGALRPGRSLEQLVAAVPLMDDSAILVLLGHENSYTKTTIRPLIEQLDVEHRVILVPGVDQSALPELVADADVGIVLYAAFGRNNLYCAPGKLSDYINASVPVVMPSFPPIRRLMEKYQLGACFAENTPSAIAAAVNTVLSRPKVAWQHQMLPAQQELIWETQEPLFLAAVARLL